MLEALSGQPDLKRSFNVVAFGVGAFTAAKRSVIAGLGFRVDQAVHAGGTIAQHAGYYR